MSSPQSIEITHKHCKNNNCRISKGLQPASNFANLTKENFDHSMQCKYCDRIDSTLQDLVKTRIELGTDIEVAARQLESLKRKYKHVDSTILQTCPHVWVQDRTKELVPFERYDYYCNRCRSVRITPGR
jgi:hypothetical protein